MAQTVSVIVTAEELVRLAACQRSNTTTARATPAFGSNASNACSCGGMLRWVPGSGCSASLSATSPVAVEGAADAQGRRMIGDPVALGHRVRPPAEHEPRRDLYYRGIAKQG